MTVVNRAQMKAERRYAKRLTSISVVVVDPVTESVHKDTVEVQVVDDVGKDYRDTEVSPTDDMRRILGVPKDAGFLQRPEYTSWEDPEDATQYVLAYVPTGPFILNKPGFGWKDMRITGNQEEELFYSKCVLYKYDSLVCDDNPDRCSELRVVRKFSDDEVAAVASKIRFYGPKTMRRKIREEEKRIRERAAMRGPMPPNVVVIDPRPSLVMWTVDCAHCHTPMEKKDAKKCSACRSVYYCGVECQRAHWKRGGHKQVCCVSPA